MAHAHTYDVFSTEIDYTVSANPIVDKNYRGIPHRIISRDNYLDDGDDGEGTKPYTAFGLYSKLRDGHAINAVCENSSLKSKDFDHTHFICMDFDGEKDGFSAFQAAMSGCGIPPTIIHSSCSDGLTAFDDGSIKHKYHCYWVFGDALDYNKRNLYANYLLKKFPNADSAMRSRVQWSGGMRVGISEEEKDAKSAISEEMWSSAEFDEIMGKNPILRKDEAVGDKGSRREKKGEYIQVEDCWQGKPRNLSIPIGMEFDEHHIYRYKGEEGEVKGRTRLDDGKLVPLKLRNGQRRRRVLFSVCCQLRINAGDDDGIRVGFDELVYNLNNFAFHFVEYGDKVDDNEIRDIAERVMDMPFNELRRSVGLRGKAKVDMEWLRKTNGEREANGEGKIHHNTLLSLSVNSELDKEVIRILKGHYADKPKEQLGMLKEYGMEITRYELYGVKGRHKEVFPKKPSRDDILDMLADCEDITVKGRLSFLEENYGVRISKRTLMYVMEQARGAICGG